MLPRSLCFWAAAILGQISETRQGNYHIVLNGNVNYETQYSVFLHKIKHIIYDMLTIGYIIELDMQY